MLQTIQNTLQVHSEEEISEVYVNEAFVGDSAVPMIGRETEAVSVIGRETEVARMEYNAASPDEKALVEACEQFGVQVEGRDFFDIAFVSLLARRRAWRKCCARSEIQEVLKRKPR